MLKKFFTPQKIAVIGASGDPNKLGYDVINNLLRFEFPGSIHPVSKSYNEILGVTCHVSIEDLPDDIDLALVIIPAKAVPGVVEKCGEKGIRNIIVMSGGFSETGEQGRMLEEKLKETAQRLGVRVIGPNCIGVIDTHTPLNTTFIIGMPEKGEIGFISQSGALVVAVIDWAAGSGIGFSRMASLGNQMDITETDMIDEIGQHRETKVITAYAEGITDGRKFLQKATEISLSKPFMILKGGQSDKGALAVSSHTGALSGSNDAYNAAFRKAGILKAENMEVMFDSARALAWQPLPKGNRVAVLTNAGGLAILTVDAIEKNGMEIAPLTEETKSFLKTRLPAAASVNNPVDVLAGSGPAVYGLALDALLADETVDAVVVIQVPQDWFLPSGLAEVVAETSKLHRKPVLTSIMGKESSKEALEILNKRRIPNVPFPERTAAILQYMVERKDWLDLMNEEQVTAFDDMTETPQKPSGADELAASQQWEALAGAYDIPLPEQDKASDADEAVGLSEKIGYPVVMKMISEKFTHKSDVGGIKMGLNNEDDVRNAWNEITAAASDAGAELQGVLIQKMLTGGQEVIIGIKQDPQFGPLIVFGTGGTEVELYKDIETAIAPLNEGEARRLIASTIAGRKLKGWRNLPPADMDAVVDILIKMGNLAAGHPEIQEMEMNPLYVLEQGKGTYAIDIRGALRSS